MSIVAIIYCGSYAYDEVLKAVERGFSLLGGPSAVVRPNEKILRVTAANHHAREFILLND